MTAPARTGAGPAGAEATPAAASGWGPALLGLLGLAAGYAAFAGGAIETPAESRVQAGLALTLVAAVGGVAFGRLRAPAAGAAWAGAAALAALGAWSAVSIAWSILPDGSWLAANRALAYAVVVAVALVAAASTRNAPVLVAFGLVALALGVALFALAGKLFPGVELGPVAFDPGDEFARLREPLDYWNALALLCVAGTPVAIWLAAARDAAPRYRVAAMAILTLLVLVAALAYSRGAVLAYAVAVATMVAAGPRRLTRLGVSVLAVLAAGPAMVLAFTRRDLSAEDVALADRIEGGLLLAGILALSLVAVALGGRELARLEGKVRWDRARARRAWLGVGLAALAVVVAGAVLLATSDRGFTGEISHRVEELKEPGTTLSNQPERLVSANGSSRYVWWQEAAGAWSDRPIEGWGAGSFPALHYLYRRYEAPVLSSHSLPLMLASETGLVGAILGLGGLGLLGWAAAARIRASRGAARSARLALAAAALAWFAHSLVDWHWEIPGVSLPALIALAAAAAPAAGGAPGRAGRLRGGLAVAAAGLAAAALTASAALPSLSEDARLRALELAAEGRAGEAAEEAELAHDLNPLASEPLFVAAGIELRRGRGEEALALLERAADTQPENWQAHRRLVFTSLLLDRGASTAAAWRDWADTDPLFFRRQARALAARRFATLHPPSASPTAFGTPPRR